MHLGERDLGSAVITCPMSSWAEQSGIANVLYQKNGGAEGESSQGMMTPACKRKGWMEIRLWIDYRRCGVFHQANIIFML